ncbi:MAG: DUF5995 family protein [bacterium]|nr:DUF5995 family protein [bacterium]
MPAKSIDGILQKLAEIIASARKDRNRVGYFAAFYSRLIVRVRDGIADGVFDDGSRVERLSVVLAERYFEAVGLFNQGGRPMRSWEIALRANRDFWLLVPQHILLALNAHINLDLAVATVASGPADALPKFRADFERMDRMLSELLEEVLQELRQIWPALGAIDPLIRGPENSLMRFSLNRAREHAWDLAHELDGLNAAARGPILDRHDSQILAIAEAIRNPGLQNVPLMSVRLIERGGVAETIELLQ